MKKATYEEFIQKLKTYNYDSIEEAAVAITEGGDFDRLEALLFIVHYGYGGEIERELYNQLSNTAEFWLEVVIEKILAKVNAAADTCNVAD